VPQVPYRPFPTVEPALRPIPSLGLRVPGEAFGTNIASATERLGGTVEKVADEAAKQAIAYQALNNDTWAKNAFAGTEVELGKLQENFKLQEGVNATAGLDGHIQAIQDARTKALDSAPNPMARKLLDDVLTRRVAFQVVDSNNHAGNQAKVAANEAAQSRLDAAKANYDPTSSGARSQEKVIESEVRHLGAVKGWERDKIDNEVRKQKSDAIANGYSKLSLTNPDAAAEGVARRGDEIVNTGQREQLQAKINAGVVSKSSLNDANVFLSGGEVAGTSLSSPFNPKDIGRDQEILEAAEEAGRIKGKNVPGYQEAFVRNVMNKVHAQTNAYKAAMSGQMDTLSHFIVNQNIIDEQGLNADPKMRELFGNMGVKEQNAIRGLIAKNAKGTDPNPLDPAVIERVRVLRGSLALAKTGDQQALEDFSTTSILEAEIPKAEKKRLINEKLALTGKAEGDPRFTSYLRDAQKVLSTVGIGPTSGKTEADKRKSEEYLKFSGEFHGAIEAWEVEHGGKPPSEKEREGIAQSLVKKQVIEKKGGGWFGRDLTGDRYKIYSENRDSLVQALTTSLGRPPREVEIQDMFRKRFPGVQ
jgi:hypothetical protein